MVFVFATLWNLSLNAWATPNTKQVIQYLNPIHEKSYLNESQDRAIKKKSFKSSALEGSQPIANCEIGLFATLDSQKLAGPSSLAYLCDVDNLLKHPSVNGISCLIAWKQLEPSENTYNWQILDELLDKCARYHKPLILRVSTCGIDSAFDAKGNRNDTDKASPQDTSKATSDTPQWVFASGVKSLLYAESDGEPHLMPIFWDNTYLAKWSNFVQALGARYDKNPNLHSVGITGGGTLGSTNVVPDFTSNKANYEDLSNKLKSEFGMSPRQLVEHWKYVSDLFPKAFPTARLNFDIDPPTPNRAGQDTLDEICDYLVFRYGERIYLTRQDVINAKHGFDQYRIILKFKGDTLTGYQLGPKVQPEVLEKISQTALDDGISFAEIPCQFFLSHDESITKWLGELRAHLGYQLVSQKVDVATPIKSGEPLKAAFTFLNLGSAAPMKPSRYFDKDRASSYKVQLELRDQSGKPVVLSLHTPSIPTNRWLGRKPVSWEEELKMPKLAPGQYSVWVSLVDADSNRKLNLLDARSEGNPNPHPECEIAAGTVQVVE
jgi:hypothetical protein